MYTVSVEVACQFENTQWDYLGDPVYMQDFEDFDDAYHAYENGGWIDRDEVAEKFRKQFPDCVAFELEDSISEDGDFLERIENNEYFYNERIWTKEGWDY